jgi:hypothetical protein
VKEGPEYISLQEKPPPTWHIKKVSLHQRNDQNIYCTNISGLLIVQPTKRQFDSRSHRWTTQGHNTWQVLSHVLPTGS